VTFNPGFAFATRISLAQATRLLNFVVISRSDGPAVQFGLYTNGADDKPDVLVAETPASGVTLSVGIVRAVSSPLCDEIGAGDYWIAIAGSESFQLAGQTSGSTTVLYWGHTFGDALAAANPNTTATAVQPFNEYILVD
jgi:hypothetical protein